MNTNMPRLAATVVLLACPMASRGVPPGEFEVRENASEIRISSSLLEAVIRKEGYVSGVYGETFLDKTTGFRDVGFGLDIVDWTLEPGSDAAYRDKLDPDLVYDF